MSDVLPKTKEEFLKIQHVTAANYNKFGEYFLKITQKYREMVTVLEAKMKSSSSIENDRMYCSTVNYDDGSDWVIPSSQAKGVKRKSTTKFKRGGAKRTKGTYRKQKRKSPGKKKTYSPRKFGGNRKRGGSSKGGGLGLMPVLHIT